MKNGIILDANDLKKILAKHFNVDESQIIKSQYSWVISMAEEITEE